MIYEHHLPSLKFFVVKADVWNWCLDENPRRITAHFSYNHIYCKKLI